MSVTLNFPSNPTQGQAFTSQGLTFIFDGGVWTLPDPFPWATDAEAVAGTGGGRMMNPAATRALLNSVPAGALSAFGAPSNQQANRGFSVNYQNTLGRPMLVAVTFWDRDNAHRAAVNVGAANVNPPAVRLADLAVARGGQGTLVFVVPTAWWYRLIILSGRSGNTSWWEWR
jgi:hypothetical protein